MIESSDRVFDITPSKLANDEHLLETLNLVYFGLGSNTTLDTTRKFCDYLSSFGSDPLYQNKWDYLLQTEEPYLRILITDPELLHSIKLLGYLF